MKHSHLLFMPVILAALLGISSCKKDYAISRDDYETEYTLYEENTNVELVRTTDLEAFAFALNKAIKERPNLTSAIKENVKKNICGSAPLYYFDNPEKQITFQNYGATMTISEFRGNE